MWHKTSEQLPQEGIVVDTKIEDEHGCRNTQRLYRRGNIWYLADGSMYVYYTPTHWKGLCD